MNLELHKCYAIKVKSDTYSYMIYCKVTGLIHGSNFAELYVYKDFDEKSGIKWTGKSVVLAYNRIIKCKEISSDKVMVYAL